MAARASLRKDDFSSIQHPRILCEICGAAGRVFQFVRPGGFQEEQRHVRSLRLSSRPECGVLTGHGIWIGVVAGRPREAE